MQIKENPIKKELKKYAESYLIGILMLIGGAVFAFFIQFFINTFGETAMKLFSVTIFIGFVINIFR